MLEAMTDHPSSSYQLLNACCNCNYLQNFLSLILEQPQGRRCLLAFWRCMGGGIVQLMSRPSDRDSPAPVVHHGGGVGPVLGRGDLLEHREGGEGLEAKLRHKFGARVHAWVQAVPAIVVVVAVAPAGIRCINSPPASMHPRSSREQSLLCHQRACISTLNMHACAFSMSVHGQGDLRRSESSSVQARYYCCRHKWETSAMQMTSTVNRMSRVVYQKQRQS